MIISVVGSGGKTTKIKELAKKYVSENKTVLITTSTHMFIEEKTLVDPTYEQIMDKIKLCGYAHAGNRASENKITGLDVNLLEKLKQTVDVILIEADGSKHLPLKYPRDHEPCVDKASDQVILMTSLKGLNQPVKEVVHGYEACDQLDKDSKVTPEIIQYLLRVYLDKLKGYSVQIEVKEAKTLYEKAIASLLESNQDVALLDPMWFEPQPKLVILGAGHISRYVNQLAKMLDFYTIVIDNREEFANQGYFPDANEVHCIDYSKAPLYFPKESNTCYVIVTRGHKDDKLCLEFALLADSMYLGMIGSKKKVKQTFDTLLQEGYTQEQLSKVYAPIGLDIKAITPAEIAVSILAQIIEIKNKRSTSSLTADLFDLKESGVLCVILSKKGSTPRPVGSMMYVTKNQIYGSVGGGNIENHVILNARNHPEVSIQHFELNNSEGATLGMICGGSNDVLFIPIK